MPNAAAPHPVVVVPNDPLDHEAHRDPALRRVPLGRFGGPRLDKSRLGTTLQNASAPASA